MQQDKTYIRYLTVAIKLRVSGDVDKNLDEYIEELADEVFSNLTCEVDFTGDVEAGYDSETAVMLDVEITGSECCCLLESKPIEFMDEPFREPQ